MSEPILEVKNVTMNFRLANDRLSSLKEYMFNLLRKNIHYSTLTALDDVSFDIKKGEVFGIVGTNGSGKSTLLKILSGILMPTKGSSVAHGVIAPMLELGAGFDDDLTAYENVFLNGAILGYSKAYLQSKYDDIVAFAELEEFMGSPIRVFSSGMVMRLAFSIATIVDPDILIVDEILAVGDARFQKKSRERMEELMSGGTTVIIVSHTLSQIRDLCTRVMWLEKGVVKMIGDTKEVCDAYAEYTGDNEKNKKKKLFRVISQKK